MDIDGVPTPCKMSKVDSPLQEEHSQAAAAATAMTLPEDQSMCSSMHAALGELRDVWLRLGLSASEQVMNADLCKRT